VDANKFPVLSNEELKSGLERLPCWKDAVLMAILVPYYNLVEFNALSPKDENGGKTIAGVLQLMGLIEQDLSRRFKMSVRGKQFMRWAIDSRIITPYDGADFIVKYGGEFGRRIMYDCVFVPSSTPAIPDDVKAEVAAEVSKA
jgi:hypothetical protein